MEYATIPGVGKPVSRIVHGATMVNDKTPHFELLDAVYSHGVNTIDTGRVYGDGNERNVGKWIRERGLRDQIVFIGKGAHHNALRRRVTPWDITADITDTLACSGLDYIDLYILHRDDPTFPVGLIVDCLNEHVRAGRIRAFGGSNWTYTRVQEANTHARLTGQVGFALSNPHFSLAEQYDEPWLNCHSITGAGAAAKAEREWFRKSQFPLFTWSTLSGGFLSGRFTRETLKTNDMLNRCYGREDNFRRLDRAAELAKEKGLSIPQLATAYVYNQGFNLFTLIAAMSGDECAANIAAMQLKLTPAECAWLNLESETR